MATDGLGNGDGVGLDKNYRGIGSYWGILLRHDPQNRYWGMLFNSKILIGECPGLIGDYWGLMGYWGMCAKSLLGNVKKRGNVATSGREIAIGECRRRLPGRREIAIGEIRVPRKYRVAPYASMVHSNQKIYLRTPHVK